MTECLKRTSPHGIYEIRTDQSDRGVFFTRGSQSTEQPSIDLAEILDDSVELTAKIRSVFDSLNKLDGIPFPRRWTPDWKLYRYCTAWTLPSPALPLSMSEVRGQYGHGHTRRNRNNQYGRNVNERTRMASCRTFDRRLPRNPASFAVF